MGSSRLFLCHWVRFRFPPSLWLAAAIPLASSFALYHAHSRTLPAVHDSVTLAVSSVLLFAQLRLADDYQDAPRSQPNQRALLALLFLLAGAALLLLNNEPATRLLVAVANLAMAGNVAWLARLAAADPAGDVLTTGRVGSDLVVGVLSETPPLILVAYPYAAWVAGNGRDAQWPMAACTILALWTAYLFWKHGRRWSRPEWRPYGLNGARHRQFMAAIALAWLVSQLGLAWFVGNAPWYGVACLAVGAFIVASLPAPLAAGQNEGRGRFKFALAGATSGLFAALALTLSQAPGS